VQPTASGSLWLLQGCSRTSFQLAIVGPDDQEPAAPNSGVPASALAAEGIVMCQYSGVVASEVFTESELVLWAKQRGYAAAESRPSWKSNKREMEIAS
jgi:hypothetical protein